MIDIIKSLLGSSQSKSLDISLNALDDIGYLIEKSTMENVKNEDYEFLFHQYELKNEVVLEHDLLHIKYFLFYVLMNFPDRSSRVAWCLGKFYDKTILEGLCQAIELYFYKNDETVTLLIKSITDINQFEDLNERVLILFEKIYENGLPYSKQFVSSQLMFYKKIYGFSYKQ